ncbi:hypothetical protein JCM10207_000234 [Rhodosporidiobolus poonsookiae]
MASSSSSMAATASPALPSASAEIARLLARMRRGIVESAPDLQAEDLRPGAGDAGHGRLLQSCAPCRKLKAKCKGAPGQTCERCEVKGIECYYLEQQKMGRKVSSKKKVKLLELKQDLDRLHDLLLAPESTRLTPPNSSAAAARLPDLPSYATTLASARQGGGEDDLTSVLTNPMSLLSLSTASEAPPAVAAFTPSPAPSPSSSLFDHVLDADPLLDPVYLGLVTETEFEQLLRLPWSSAVQQPTADRTWRNVSQAVRITGEIRLDLPLKPHLLKQYQDLLAPLPVTSQALEKTRLRLYVAVCCVNLAISVQTGRLLHVISAKALKLHTLVQHSDPPPAQPQQAFNQSWKADFALWDRQYGSLGGFPVLSRLCRAILLLSYSLRLSGSAEPILQECWQLALKGTRYVRRWFGAEPRLLFASNFFIINMAYCPLYLLHHLLGQASGEIPPAVSVEAIEASWEVVRILECIKTARLHGSSVAVSYAKQLRGLVGQVQLRSFAAYSEPAVSFDTLLPTPAPVLLPSDTTPSSFYVPDRFFPPTVSQAAIDPSAVLPSFGSEDEHSALSSWLAMLSDGFDSGAIGGGERNGLDTQ